MDPPFTQPVQGHEVTEAELEAFRRMMEASMALQSCREVEMASHVIAETLHRGFGFDVAVLAQVEGPIFLLRGHTVVPEGAVDLGGIDFPLRTSAHVWARIANAGGLIHSDRADGSEERLAPLGIEGEVWQPVWLPLIARGEPVGLAVAFNRSDRGAMSLGQLRVLELYANHAALALGGLRAATGEGETVRDPLTGLHTRQQFDCALEQEVRRFRRYRTPPALLMIDLNDFKSFNDAHGHLAGDEILRAAAHLIEENVRETDLVARYGGDEFVVLMPNSNDQQARAAIKRILTAVVTRNREMRHHPERQFTLTIGHHVATSDTAERVLEVADKSMYDRKDDGSRRRLLDQLIAPRGTPVGQHARLIFGLMKTLGSRDPGHICHARRVMGYSVMMCERLKLSALQTEQVAMAAILHDLGKVVINAEILRRPGPLTPSEFLLMRSHPIVTADILAELTFLEHPLRLIRHHHERWDGRTTGDYPGYPSGLKGETIPLGSRIIRIADTLDALTTDRPHREPVSFAQALEILREEAGRSLDPNLVTKCLPVFKALGRPIDPDMVTSPLPI
jgi:diguanylate cyclase (GGDEF)-like protein